MKRPPLALLAVLGLLAGEVYFGASSGDEGAADAAARRAPVVGSIVVCPELLKAGGDVATQLTLGTSLAGEINVLAASLVRGGARGQEVLAQGGEVDSFGTPGDQALAVAATALGERAGALEAEQVSRGVDGLQRGLAGVRCEPPSADTWFVGGATTTGISSQLMLVNPYDDDALVDIEVFGTGGRVDAPGAEGVLVKGRERRVVDLGELAPDERGLALHVLAREGRIAAAMRDARVVGDSPRGVDWVPRAGQPAEVVDVPGVPAGNGRRVLYLTAPGQDTAEVAMQLTLEDGQIVPAGFDEVVVRPDRVVALDLTEVIGGRPVSLRLEASGAPILASVLAENRARFNPIQEFAYVGAATAMSGPALITDGRVSDAVDTLLLLSSPDGEATVEIRMMPIARRPGTLPAPQRVTIPEGRLVVVSLSSPAYRVQRLGGQRPFVVTPLGDSRVFGSRVLAEVGLRGPLFTVLSLTSQQVAGVTLTEVAHDPAVSLVRQPRPRDDELDLEETPADDESPAPSASASP